MMMKSRLVAVTLLASFFTASPVFAGDTVFGAWDKDHYMLSHTPSGLGPGLLVDYMTIDRGLSDLKDTQVAALGLSFGVPLGKFTTSTGAKAMYIESQDHLGDRTKTSYDLVGLIGAELAIDLPYKAILFGNYYYSASSTDHIESIKDYRLGLRWKPIPLVPVNVEGGWRSFDMQKDVTMNSVLAEGWYAGLSIGF
jgi:hypothetical protein